MNFDLRSKDAHFGILIFVRLIGGKIFLPFNFLTQYGIIITWKWEMKVDSEIGTRKKF